jgi:serine/threonine-protein kinase
MFPAVTLLRLRSEIPETRQYRRSTLAISQNTFRSFVTGPREIGPYQVLSSIGRGGMAEVLLARHRHLGQLRALKILLPEIATQPEVVGRLLTEGRAMSRLRHPAIVELFDCDVLADGTAYIAMEYLPGEPLRRWHDRTGKLARHPYLAAAIVGTIGEGLAFAHREGVVHRDLKSENVVLVPSPDGTAGFSLKILDFGVAKLLQDTPITRTRIGCVVGTPTIMAPEQWRAGGPIDHRVDIYALGCLFFELLTGRAVFPGRNELELMRAHLNAPVPDMASSIPGLPGGFQTLVARMLAKSPDQRPQTVEQVLGELETLLGQPRQRWKDLLRTPEGLPLYVPAPVTETEDRASAGRHLGRSLFAAALDRILGGSGRRLALTASLIALGAAGLAAAFLVTEDKAPRTLPGATRAAENSGPVPATAPPPSPQGTEERSGIAPDLPAVDDVARPKRQRASRTSTPALRPSAARMARKPVRKPEAGRQPGRRPQAKNPTRSPNVYQRVGDCG